MTSFYVHILTITSNYYRVIDQYNKLPLPVTRYLPLHRYLFFLRMVPFFIHISLHQYLPTFPLHSRSLCISDESSYSCYIRDTYLYTYISYISSRIRPTFLLPISYISTYLGTYIHEYRTYFVLTYIPYISSLRSRATTC